MKVLIVNTYDRGGAANSCQRLHLGLLNAGIDSKVLLKKKQDIWPQSFKYEPAKRTFTIKQKVEGKLKRVARDLKIYNPEKASEQQLEFLKNRPVELEMVSFPKSNIDITLSPLYKEADIINLHWVANFLDYETFFKKNNKPVIWTLHDMNPFNGVEHYKESFLGIDKRGLPQKRKISDQENRISKEYLAIKKKALAKTDNLTIVAPSKWLVREAKSSELFKNREVLHIPYGLDAKIFYPKDREKARKLLNIPPGKKVILFVSDSLKKNRKGFLFLKKAYDLLDGNDFILCAIGNIDADWKSDKEVLELGIIKDDEIMCAAYSAADVFVIPSVMDNLPNTVLESLMCGTPVIGFPVGGIPDMIENWQNGLLTEEISVNSLYKALLKFFKTADKFDRDQIRKNALAKYESKIQARKYKALFDRIMS